VPLLLLVGTRALAVLSVDACMFANELQLIDTKLTGHKRSQSASQLPSTHALDGQVHALTSYVTPDNC